MPPINPCGQITGFGRTGYRTRVNFYRDNPELWTDVVVYPVPWDRLEVPHVGLFSPNNWIWGEDLPLPGEDLEQHDYYLGTDLWCVTGDQFIGSQEQWEKGALTSDPVPAYDPATLIPAECVRSVTPVSQKSWARNVQQNPFFEGVGQNREAAIGVPSGLFWTTQVIPPAFFLQAVGDFTDFVFDQLKDDDIVTRIVLDIRKKGSVVGGFLVGGQNFFQLRLDGELIGDSKFGVPGSWLTSTTEKWFPADTGLQEFPPGIRFGRLRSSTFGITVGYQWSASIDPSQINWDIDAVGLTVECDRCI